MKKLTFLATAASALLLTHAANAQTHDHHHGHHGHAGHHSHSENLGPAGLSATHIHRKGDWMFSYKFMHMDMGGNRNGTDNLSPLDITGVIPNRFFGMPGQPSTYRIVPTKMTMQMHMLGAMYAPTDKLTLMAMANYLRKDMEHLTYAAMAPTTNIGSFTTTASGIGDTKLSGIYEMYKTDKVGLLGSLGVSLPTGSITERDTILNPMNAVQNIRLPYAMQLGSGTFDIEPTLTYQYKQSDKLNLGVQYKATLHIGRNDEGYSLGDKHALNFWGERQVREKTSITARLGFEIEDSIDGIDSNIMGPVQTADPDNYGGERIDVGLGLNQVLELGDVKNLQFGIEANIPVYQDLNGPQMERDWGISVVLRKSF